MPRYAQQVKRVHYTLKNTFEEALFVIFETHEPIESGGYERAVRAALREQYPGWGKWAELSPDHFVAAPHLTRTVFCLD